MKRGPPIGGPLLHERVTSVKHKKPRAHVEPGVLFPPCRRSSSDFPRIGNFTPLVRTRSGG